MVLFPPIFKRMRKRTVLFYFFVLLSSASGQEVWHYLDNGQIRIGINRSAGAGVGWFSESGRDRNLLNRFDYGRYLQQSWYGSPDGSKWSGKPWVWNPVQVGGWQGKAAKVLDFKMDESRIFARTTPRHWAAENEIEEVQFEEEITLHDYVARIHFSMKYTGKTAHSIHDQELPAMFVNPEYSNLHFIKPGDSKPHSIRPGWPNERYQIFNEWVAYLDENGRGIGIHVPGIKTITCYRSAGDKKNRDKGACSYVAPIKRMEIKPGFHYEYDVYLTIGTLPEIRHRFAEIRKKANTGN